MKMKILFLAALVIASCSPIRGCMQSSFTLAPESRLPGWFSLPSGYARDAVTVNLYYFSSPFPVDDVELELTDRNDKKLAVVTGKMCWPEMEEKRHKDGEFDPDRHSYYVFVRANGKLEVLEHGNQSTFRISDDPELMKEAAESKKCNK